jgi:hypothetical protein
MFILIFFVLFGIKKSSIQTYQTHWLHNANNFLSLLALSLKNIVKNQKNLTLFTTINFQFSILISRTTTIVLLSFWTFIFFFGDFLILLLINFTTLTDSIPSSNFFFVKHHFFSDLAQYSFALSQDLLTVICWLSLASFFYLISLKWPFLYLLNINIFFLDIFFFFIIFIFIIPFKIFLLFGFFYLIKKIK